MSISDNEPQELSSPHDFAVQHREDVRVEAGASASDLTSRQFATHQFATDKFDTIEKDEEPFVSSDASRTWNVTGTVLAIVFFTAILIVGVTAERTLERYAPASKPAPTSGMVIEQPAATPQATPAFPTVYVEPSADPSQAPSPLPDTPPKTN